MHIAKKIALIVGSSRAGGNGAGIASWISPIIRRRLQLGSHNQQPSLNRPSQSLELVVVDPTKPPHPFGPVVDGSLTPSQIRDPSQYSSQTIRDWSTFVSSCAGFIILTPEYNGGYPGELKNAIDHIFWEWKDKAVMVVSYGGGGGARSAAQLKDVLKSVKVRQVDKSVQIRLPKTFTTGDDRVGSGESFPEFLTEYVQPVEAVTGELMELISQGERT